MVLSWDFQFCFQPSVSGLKIPVQDYGRRSESWEALPSIDIGGKRRKDRPVTSQQTSLGYGRSGAGVRETRCRSMAHTASPDAPTNISIL